MPTPEENLRRILEMADKIAPGVSAGLLSPVVTCGACKQKNRVPKGKAGARCGKCGLPLKTP